MKTGAKLAAVFTGMVVGLVALKALADPPPGQNYCRQGGLCTSSLVQTYTCVRFLGDNTVQCSASGTSYADGGAKPSAVGLDGGGAAGQVGVFGGPATMKGDPNFTWAGGRLVVDGGATFDGGVYIWSLNLGNALPINQGGTGQNTATTAFNALAPSQGSASGKFLTSNGTNTSWGTVAPSSFVTVGSAAARPDAGTSGSMDFCTGCLTWFIDNGTAWQPLVWGTVLGQAPPAAAAFTAINQGSTTLVDVPSAGFGLHLSFPSGGGNQQLRSYVRTVKYTDAGTSLTIHAESAFTMTQPMNNGFPASAVTLRDSATGRQLTCGFNSAGANQGLTGQSDWYPQALYWTSPSAISTHAEGQLPTQTGLFFRIRGVSANNFACDVSYDRVNWYAMATYAQTMVPDQAGIASYMAVGADNGIETSFYDYSDGTWPDGG